MAKNENKDTEVTTPTADPVEDAKKMAKAILDDAKAEAAKIQE